MAISIKATKTRRAVLLASALGIATAAWLASPHLLSGLGLPLDPSANAQGSGRLPEFADIVERVKPAVVGLRADVDQGNEQAHPVPPGSPSEPFARPSPDRPQQPQTDAPRRPRVASQGSGFFISADGYIVTTNHLVEHSKTIEVTTDDGKTFTAKLIGADPKTDLALLKVDGRSDFPFVKLADQEPRIGEWVLAIGNPFGLGGTVTAGIVSARARDIRMGTVNDFIQIDAPVNQGNSGGPSFDLKGNVIGVNSAILSPTGVSIGIGFAIPAETVKTIITQLKEKGTVIRGWMGVQVRPVTPEVAQELGLKRVQGALVAAPQPESPAAKAGILAGDVITSVNGQPVKADRDLVRRIGDMAPGTSVKLGLIRKGVEKTIIVTLGDPPTTVGSDSEPGSGR